MARLPRSERLNRNSANLHQTKEISPLLGTGDFPYRPLRLGEASLPAFTVDVADVGGKPYLGIRVNECLLFSGHGSQSISRSSRVSGSLGVSSRGERNGGAGIGSRIGMVGASLSWRTGCPPLLWDLPRQRRFKILRVLVSIRFPRRDRLALSPRMRLLFDVVRMQAARSRVILVDLVRFSGRNLVAALDTRFRITVRLDRIRQAGACSTRLPNRMRTDRAAWVPRSPPSLR